MPTYEYECSKCGIIEIFHGIKEEPRTVCPDCGKTGLQRKISCGGAIIIKGREVNQYNDCIGAKTWRDKNGELHKVTSSDGSYKSATTTSKKFRSKEQVEAMKARDNFIRQQQRQEASYRRAVHRTMRKNKQA